MRPTTAVDCHNGPAGIARVNINSTHSTWFYKQLEGAVDGIVDFRIEARDRVGEEARTLMRIRFMKNVGFDGHWYSLIVKDNFEMAVER